jgi:hypothetical protein
VGRQINAAIEEGKNSSRNPTSGHGTSSSLAITASEINPAFFSFFRSFVEKLDLA